MAKCRRLAPRSLSVTFLFLPQYFPILPTPAATPRTLITKVERVCDGDTILLPIGQNL